MSTTITQIPARIDAALTSPWQARALAIVDAIVLNIVILLAGRVITGDWPVASVGDDEQTIGVVAVIVVTALAGLAAWGLLALLERVTARARTMWTAVAVVVFLLSLLGPLGSGVGMSSKVVLALMHLGAATTIVPLMLRSIRARSQT
jgi:hypothetical protein